MNILITSGGTEEPIDGVRYITNFSSGRTGAALAEELSALGAQVTLLHGHRASLPDIDINKESFTSFKDLNGKLETRLAGGDYDVVIHLAAVSDFSVDYLETGSGEKLEPSNEGKLSSDHNLTIHLRRNFKILDRLKDYSGSAHKIIVVGFKLTDTDSPELMETAAQNLLKSGKVDFVVQNNLRDIQDEKHPARIYSSDGALVGETETKKDMALMIHNLINGEMK